MRELIEKGAFVTKTIAVVDGNSLMHRAFHAVPPAMAAPDGTPTNAAFGFLSMLLKFIEQDHPDAIVCAFDKGRPAFRMEALEQYKAQRPPMDESLKVQFPLIEHLLEAMDIPVISLKGWEGDDVLGTIAARDEALGYRTLLVTGDKDAYQLASDLTRIVTTKRGITDVVVYGPNEVYERYGVTPAQVPDFLGLKGDQSDNIPGVPGIGEKKAAAMLQKFDSLEGIYDNLDRFKGKQLENLVNNRDAAFLSRTVATIVRDVDFDLDLEGISFPSFDPQKVSDAFQEVRFMTHLTKVLSFVEGATGGVSQKTELQIENLVREDRAHALLDDAIACGRDDLAVAWCEKTPTSLFESGLLVAVQVGTDTALFSDEEAREVLVRLVREASFTALDVKSLLGVIFPPDGSLEALVSREDVLAMKAFDVALAGYVLNSAQGSSTLAALLEHYAGLTIPEEEDDEVRVSLEAAGIAALAGVLRRELEDADAHEVYADIDAPLIGVLACMERIGAAVDIATLDRIATTTQASIDSLRDSIIEMAGEEFNLDSPKQLSHILFEVIGLKPLRKNQRGFSTDARVLKELSKEHELPKLVLRYREYAKIKSTYIDALPRMLAGDGRVHTSFNEMVTATGRLSSSDPNLQNIPVRTEYGRHIRECFVPLSDDDLFVSADYSQIELRLLAHLSNDEHLIDAFLSGADFHAQTASRVFGVPVEEVTPLLRSRAKAVNFGIVYGQQAFGLSQSLDIPFYDAKEMIDRYFEAYPGVRAYLDEVVHAAYEDGYVSTLFGRRRHIPELKMSNTTQRNFGERTAMNHPMQGTAADIIKIAMRRVQDELVSGGYRSHLMLQVHDELDLSVPVDEVDRLSAMVKDIMESVVSLSVPLSVDVTVGKNWAQAH